LGAIIVSLSTPKTGREVRKTLKDIAHRLIGRDGGSDLSEDERIEALFI
jgi:hypothetical protein